ncbi:hypothetical protein [Achromobacter sp. Root565]|uniref:hypothetical protein n=1 Tax=Achromobacter sp. Root565 TaxID=1736564 RepID=UPI0006F6611D|nr:hypothetical protein [Achromobacter sp. Root565]KQZ96151.1 hypothetical protein ASD71_26170 [Achromobacter sp. Root565]
MMPGAKKFAGVLLGWRGYAAAALAGAGAVWYVLGAVHGKELAELKLERNADDLVVARGSIEQTNRDLQSMAENARAAAAIGPELTASIGALSKALKNANPLPAGCRPDADRVRTLTDAVRAARGATAR